MDVDSCDHHCIEGEPMLTCLEIKSMLTPSTMGIRPRTVVTVVKRTGLSLCAADRRIASFDFLISLTIRSVSYTHLRAHET